VFHIISVNRYHPLTHKFEQVRVFKETKNDKKCLGQDAPDKNRVGYSHA